jgi:hypothetical protein
VLGWLSTVKYAAPVEAADRWADDKDARRRGCNGAESRPGRRALLQGARRSASCVSYTQLLRQVEMLRTASKSRVLIHA